MPVAFIHVDCDLYSSTKTIFSLLSDRIVPGTIILFDEYFNYPNWQQHEYKALQEFVDTKNIKYRIWHSLGSKWLSALNQWNRLNVIPAEYQ